MPVHTLRSAARWPLLLITSAVLACAMIAGSALTAHLTAPSTAENMVGAARLGPSGKFLVYPDLAYAAPEGRAHLLDIYRPTTGPGPFPVVIYQGGSGWLSDDTKGPWGPATSALAGGSADALLTNPATGPTPELLADLWAAHGYAVVGLNVRSSRQAHSPGQVHDAKAAVRWLRAHARQYGLDPTRFAMIGTSSGGWVSLMTALTAHDRGLEGDLGNSRQSSSVQAAVDLFGPTDLLTMQAQNLRHGRAHDSATSTESRLVGCALQRCKALSRRASPITYVRPGAPPIYLAHGTADPIVPWQQSVALFDALTRTKNSATLVLVPRVGHNANYLVGRPGADVTVKQTRGGTVATRTHQFASTYADLLAFLDTALDHRD